MTEEMRSRVHDLLDRLLDEIEAGKIKNYKLWERDFVKDIYEQVKGKDKITLPQMGKLEEIWEVTRHERVRPGTRDLRTPS